MFARVTALTIVAVFTAVPTQSQERFSFFQASTPESVEQMLTMAGLRDDDVVLDLGSGNGLIPLTAARMNPRLRGLGVDIDPELVEQSNERARSEGVADRVRFEHRNAFDADLREATVITMWLFPELMNLLRPVILERARPGTRVVTSTWGLGSWQPDEIEPRRLGHLYVDCASAHFRWLGLGSQHRGQTVSLRFCRRPALSESGRGRTCW